MERINKESKQERTHFPGVPLEEILSMVVSEVTMMDFLPAKHPRGGSAPIYDQVLHTCWPMRKARCWSEGDRACELCSLAEKSLTHKLGEHSVGRAPIGRRAGLGT